MPVITNIDESEQVYAGVVVSALPWGDSPGGAGDAPSGGDGDASSDDEDADNNAPWGSDYEDDDGDDDEDPLQIFVKIPTGENITLLVLPSCSIAAVKVLVQNKVGIPSREQRLLFAGQQLEGDLADYDVVVNSVLTLSLRLKGGGKQSTKNKSNSSSSKVEKCLMSKFRASTAASLTSAHELKEGIMQDTNRKFLELMTGEDLILAYLSKATKAELDVVVEELGKMKLQEVSIHRLACLMPEMVALSEAVKQLEAVGKALELAFCFNFTQTFYNAETEAYDFKRFTSALSDAINRKVLEEEILARHGLAMAE